MVTNAVGYLYKGTASGKSEWVIGGQITMDAVTGRAFYALGTATTIAALLTMFAF